MVAAWIGSVISKWWKMASTSFDGLNRRWYMRHSIVQVGQTAWIVYGKTNPISNSEHYIEPQGCFGTLFRLLLNSRPTSCDLYVLANNNGISNDQQPIPVIQRPITCTVFRELNADGKCPDVPRCSAVAWQKRPTLYEQNGLNSLRYKLVGAERRALYTWLLVTLPPPPAWRHVRCHIAAPNVNLVLITFPINR